MPLLASIQPAAPTNPDLAAANYDETAAHALIDRYIEHLAHLLETAGTRGVALALLPECSLPVGPCRPSVRERLAANCRYAEPRWLERCADLARRYGMSIASCYYRAEGDRLFNDGVLVNPHGDVAGVYHKVHLPCDVAWDATEAGLFVAGHDYPVFETPIGRVGFQICYDIDFPEGSAALALNGCELLLHPTVGYNFPDEEETVAEARLRTRAVDNSIPLLYSNFGPTPGRSCVIGANGSVLACAGRGADVMAVAEVDLKATRHQVFGDVGYPDHRLTIARKRRPDTYGVLTQRVPPYLQGKAEPGQRTYEYGDDVGLER